MFVHRANPALYRPLQRFMYHTYLVPAFFIPGCQIFFKNKNFNFLLSWCYVTDFIEGLIRTICFIIECIKSSLLERLERHCRSYII